MFKFSCRFAFYKLFFFQTLHRKWHEFRRCIKQTRQLWRCAILKNIYLSLYSYLAYIICRQLHTIHSPMNYC